MIKIKNDIIYNVEKDEYGYEIETDQFGNKHWRLNGSLHREDGPAIENHDGNNLWYKHGNVHREDGPAIIYSNGNKEYWLNNKKYNNIQSDDEWIIFNIIT
jgi:hypothetical protein